MSTVRSSTVPDIRLGRERRRRIITVLAAVVLALVGWAVAGPLLGVPLRVRTASGAPITEVPAGAVAIASLLAGLAGWGVLALLARLTTSARRIWTVVAVVVLLVSIAGPLGGVQPSTVVALICLHLLVGGVLIVGFRRSMVR